MYEYGSLDSPDGEVEGMKVGDIVDYMTYGYYQNQNPEGAFGREESHFENLPKSKYAPLPWKINDELNGGWSGFDKMKVMAFRCSTIPNRWCISIIRCFRK